jgi:hypothetical protein
MIGRAARERWPVSDEHRAASVDILAGIIADPNIPERTKLAAIQSLTKIDSLNIADRRLTIAEGIDYSILHNPAHAGSEILAAARRAGVLPAAGDPTPPLCIPESVNDQELG